jgi:hypothetical protein
MQDWKWICYGVASSKSRLNSVWLFVLGHCERTFPNLASELNTEYRFALMTSKSQHGKCLEENWEKLKFLRRKERRFQMTSN